MADDDFFQLIDTKKLKTYISKSNKALGTGVFLFGFIIGAIFPVIKVDPGAFRKGLILGFVFGLAWAGLRYRRLGTAGIVKAQGDIIVILLYLVYFSFGVFGGHCFLRPLLSLTIGL